jgi:hypothetical protein
MALNAQYFYRAILYLYIMRFYTKFWKRTIPCWIYSFLFLLVFLQTCDFQKAHSNSALRVTYQGDLRVVSCSNGKCCRRWLITIKGKGCSSPAPIDAVIAGYSYLCKWSQAVWTFIVLVHWTASAFCNNIPKGKFTVGLSVGNCKNWSHDEGNAYTCWNSVCRLIIEEISPFNAMNIKRPELDRELRK